MEDLILHAHILYDHEVVHPSPPLPPTPAGEPVPPVSYGTKRTKVATIPSFTDALPPLLTHDFTPRLPPRPNNSIHPSGRGNTSSPTKFRAPLLPEKPQTQPQPVAQHDSATIPEDSPTSSPTAESFMTTTEETRDDLNSIYFPVQDSPPTPSRSLPQPPQTHPQVDTPTPK